MAFAGITTVKDVPPPGAGTWAGGAGAKRVHWHACHNFGQHHEDSESEDCWREGLAGAPRETDDVGDFLPLEGWTGSVWRESDPEGTLEEEWERVSDGGGQFLAVRKAGALLVLSDRWFGYAEDTDHHQMFAAGEITAEDGWMVRLSTSRALEGRAFLGLSGGNDEASLARWTVLPGSTLSWPLREGELPALPRFRSKEHAHESVHEHARDDTHGHAGESGGCGADCEVHGHGHSHESSHGTELSHEHAHEHAHEHEHEHEDGCGCCGRRVHTEGAAVEHVMHAMDVRNDWVARMMREAEEEDKAAGVWDTAKLKAEVEEAAAATAAAAKAAEADPSSAMPSAPAPAPAALSKGTRVELIGLQAAPELNGELGEVVGRQPGKRQISGQARHRPRARVEGGQSECHHYDACRDRIRNPRVDRRTIEINFWNGDEDEVLQGGITDESDESGDSMTRRFTHSMHVERLRPGDWLRPA